MTDEQKTKLFETMYEFEKLADTETYDGVNYFDKANGAYEMLRILGINIEYLHWAENRD